MPNKKKPVSKKSRSSRSPNVKNATEKALLQSSRMQETRFRPEIADIPWPTIKRNKVHTVLQSFFFAGPTAGVSGIGSSITLHLDDLPDATAYKAAFDMYRIACVRIQFVVSLYDLFTAIDYTDPTAPTSLNQVLAYDTLQIVPANVIHERVFAPAYNIDLTGAEAQGSIMRTWIPTATSDAIWQSLKVWVASGVGTGPTFQAFVSVVLNLRATN